MKKIKSALIVVIASLTLFSCSFSTYPEVCTAYGMDRPTQKGAKAQVRYIRHHH